MTFYIAKICRPHARKTNFELIQIKTGSGHADAVRLAHRYAQYRNRYGPPRDWTVHSVRWVVSSPLLEELSAEFERSVVVWDGAGLDFIN